MTVRHARRKPKSQSEIAADKKSKALDRAGTAVSEGKPRKAKKIAEKAAKAKKPSAQQAVQVLSEAHALEMQITTLDLKIDGYKEAYKEAKSQREVLLNRLRGEVRDMGQGRLPFGANAKAEPVNGEAAKAKAKPAKGAAAEPKGETPAPVDETEKAVERELEAPGTVE